MVDKPNNIDSGNKETAPEKTEKTLPLEKAQEVIRNIVDEGIELNFGERWKALIQHPKAVEDLKAAGRAVGNALITGADFVPLIGDIPSWLNTATKFVPKLKRFDLTPDIKPEESAAVQGIAVPVEVATSGVAPTHVYELVKQTIIDAKRGSFESAKNTLGYLFTGKLDYLDKLHKDSEILDAAASVFVSKEVDKG